jgi:hypothetical protein
MGKSKTGLFNDRPRLVSLNFSPSRLIIFPLFGPCLSFGIAIVIQVYCMHADKANFRAFIGYVTVKGVIFATGGFQMSDYVDARLTGTGNED